MSNIHSSVQKAYNRHANHYDNRQSSDGWIRQQLWKEYRTLFHSSDHILDLGCGTGIDTIYLAQQIGCQVTAVDISVNMLNKLKEKASSHQLRDRITIIQSPIEQLTYKSFASLDGVVSAFATINTVDNYSHLNRFLSAQLRPGATVLFHGLNRYSTLSLPHFRRTLTAKRSYRERGDGELVDIENVKVPHQLLDPINLYRRYFEDDFMLSRVYGIGWLAHPSKSYDSSSTLFKIQRYIDMALGSYKVFRQASRYFVLIMRKT